MSSWLCRLGSRGKRWVFLSDQFPTRRDWLLGFEGSCRNKNSLSSSLRQQHSVQKVQKQLFVSEQWLHEDITPGEPLLGGIRAKRGFKVKSWRGGSISNTLEFKENNSTFGFGAFPCTHITSTL